MQGWQNLIAVDCALLADPRWVEKIVLYGEDDQIVQIDHADFLAFVRS